MKTRAGVNFCLSPGVPIVLSYLQPFQLSQGSQARENSPRALFLEEQADNTGKETFFSDHRVWKRRVGEFSKTLLMVAATCLSVRLGKRSPSKIITKSVEKRALLSV